MYLIALAQECRSLHVGEIPFFSMSPFSAKSLRFSIGLAQENSIHNMMPEDEEKAIFNQ